MEFLDQISLPFCKPCGHVVQGGVIIKHMTTVHRMPTDQASGVSERIKKLESAGFASALRGAYLSREPRGSEDALPPLPHVKISRGFMCSTCKLWLGCVDSVRKHSRRVHGEAVSMDEIRKTEHAVQNLYSKYSKSSFYFPVNMFRADGCDGDSAGLGAPEEAKPGFHRKAGHILRKIANVGVAETELEMRQLGSYVSVTRNDVALREIGLSLHAAHSLAVEYDGRVARDAGLRKAVRRYFENGRAALRSCSFSIRREIGRMGREFSPYSIRPETWEKYDARASMLALLSLRLMESQKEEEAAIWDQLAGLHESTAEIAALLTAPAPCADQPGDDTREQRLQDALHRHFLAWLINKPETRGRDAAVSTFILLSSCVRYGGEGTATYRFASGKDVSPILAALQAATHLVAGVHATRGESHADVEDRLLWLESQKASDMISEPMEVVKFYQNICVRLRSTEYRVDRFTLCGAPDHATCGIIDGVELSASRIGDALRGLKRRADKLLLGDDGLLFGKSTPLCFPQSLELFTDKPGVSIPGYSWAVSTPAATQCTRAMREWAVRRVLGNVLTADSEEPIAERCDAWARKSQELAEILACMILLSGGGPLRATELANLRLQNTATSEREIFVINEQVVVIPSYNKTRALKQGVVRPTARYPCRLTSELFVRYVLLVLPMRAAVAELRAADGKGADLSFMHTLLPGEHAPWRMVERMLSAYGLPLTVSQYRQYQRGIVKHALPSQRSVLDTAGDDDDTDAGGADGPSPTLERDIYEASLLQAGHSTATAEGIYGCSSADELSALSPSRLMAFRRASQAWHQLIGAEGESPDASAKPVASKKRVDREDVEAEIDEQETPVKRSRIVDTAAEELRAELDSASETKRALRMLFGESASFRCKTQELLVRSAVERDGDVLGILPTGGGKGLAYLVPAKLSADARERGLPKTHKLCTVTVLVVPLTALVADSLRRAREAGIRAMDMTSLSRADATAVVEDALECELLVCSVEFACGGTYATLLALLRDSGRMGAIVLDEVHLLVMWERFRPVMKQVREKARPSGVAAPLVMLTATCAPSMQNRVLRACGADPEQTVVLRTATVRKNLSYEVHAVPGGALQKMPELVSDWAERHRGSSSRGIVYCRSRSAVESIARRLRDCCDESCDVGVYHAGLTDKERETAMRAWTEADVGLYVMVATVAMGVGVDCPNVRFVVHAGAPDSIAEWAQESGRSGRDGADSDCVVLLDDRFGGQIARRERGESGFGDMREIVHMASGCRRQKVQAFLDGADPGTCRTLEARLCDLCAGDAPARRGARAALVLVRGQRSQTPGSRVASTEDASAGQIASPSDLQALGSPNAVSTMSATPAFGRLVPLGVEPAGSRRPASASSSRASVARNLMTDTTFVSAGRVDREGTMLPRTGEQEVRLLKHVASKIPVCGICFLAGKERCEGHRVSACFRCQQPGHFARDCPNIAGLSAAGGSACFRCRLNTHRGHTLHEPGTYGKASCELHPFMRLCLLMFWNEGLRREIVQNVRGAPSNMSDLGVFAAWLRIDEVDGAGTGAVCMAEYIARRFLDE